MVYNNTKESIGGGYLENIIEVVMKCLHHFNELFYVFLILFFGYFFFKIIILKSGDEERYDTYKLFIKDEAQKMLIEFVLALFLNLFLAEVFQININKLFSIKMYIRAIIAVWLIYHLLQVKHCNRLYNKIKKIEKIKSGEYLRDPNIIFQEEINYCNFNIDIQKETLGIWKSFSPMAFIVLLAGRFLDNADVDKYTYVFFCGLILYFYQVWKCNNKLRTIMYNKYQLENEWNDYKQNPVKSQQTAMRWRAPVLEPVLAVDNAEFLEPDGSIRIVQGESE